MKPIYWVLIAIGSLLVIYFLYNANQNRKKAELEAAIAAQNQQPSTNLPPGYSSTLAQVISSLVPFFDIYYKSKETQKV